MPQRSLYRRVLGEQFDRLPSSLHVFHDAVRGGRGTGRFELRRGSGVIARIAARLFRLPAEGSDVAVTLDVVVEDGCERWIRDFGGRRLESVQWEHAGFLVEKAGHLRLAFRLSADDAGLRFVSRRAWFFGVPLPRWLAPEVQATVVAHEEGWRTDVRVCLPGGSLLLGYSGTIAPEIVD
jgi:Domain of unknown function (DUF4166)